MESYSKSQLLHKFSLVTVIMPYISMDFKKWKMLLFLFSLESQELCIQNEEALKNVHAMNISNLSLDQFKSILSDHEAEIDKFGRLDLFMNKIKHIKLIQVNLV